jgi:hypothetical protein
MEISVFPLRSGLNSTTPYSVEPVKCHTGLHIRHVRIAVVQIHRRRCAGPQSLGCHVGAPRNVFGSK